MRTDLQATFIELIAEAKRAVSAIAVVEVLSPSNPAQDRMLKRDLYQGLGVPAYWILDPSGPTLLALRLEHGEYTIEAETDAAFSTDWPFRVELIVADLAE